MHKIDGRLGSGLTRSIAGGPWHVTKSHASLIELLLLRLLWMMMRMIVALWRGREVSGVSGGGWGHSGTNGKQSVDFCDGG